MKDEQTILVIQSINKDDSLTPELKLELTAKIMSDCQQKKIGKIITDAIQKKKKSKVYYPDGPLKKPKRGRPKGSKNKVIEPVIISENARKQIEAVKDNPRRDF